MEKIPFKKEELEVVKTIPGRMGRDTELINTPITPRENFLMFLRHEEPLWMPMGDDTFTITPGVSADNIARGFVFDATKFDPVTQGGGPDMFGVEWEYVPTAGGSMVRPGAPKVSDITEWEKYITFPDLDSWDWAGSAELNKSLIEDDTRLRGVTILNGLFERLISFCNMNEALIAMIDEDGQEGVHRLFDKLADFYIKMIAKYKEYYKIDIVTFHDDWGSQRAPFFSLATVREMLVPYLKRIADGTHEMGLYFELHSCGKNEILVPAMIEANVDMWNGQPMNDKRMLVEKYSGQILLGAYPTEEITDDTPDEEINKIYEDFIGFFNKYPVYGGIRFGGPAPKKVVYEKSRIAKCGKA